MPGEKAPERDRRDQVLHAAWEVAVASGLEGVTVRRVAEQAGLSPGLVMFHFKNKDALILDLLEWWLTRLTFAGDAPTLPEACSPADAIAVIVAGEIERLGREGASAELFVDFWRLGMQRPGIRTRICEELQRYRAAFRCFAAQIVADRPDAEQSADALAALAVALVQGFALQSAVDPDAVRPDQYTAMATALLRRAAVRPQPELEPPEHTPLERTPQAVPRG